MDSTRTLALLLALVVVAAAGWLWKEGHLAPLAAHFTANDRTVAGGPTAESGPDEEGGEAGSRIAPPPHIVTWKDADGVVHYSTADMAPRDALEHNMGKAGTLADYEKALQEESGIDAEALYRAQQARLARERGSEPEPVPESATAAAEGSGDSTTDAARQARELLKARDETLDAIRRENAR